MSDNMKAVYSPTFKQNLDFTFAWANMTGLEKEAVRAKAQWEAMSLSAVLFDWPSYMEPSVRRALRGAGQVKRE